jgi:uncharacterized membrane-anchored protein
MRKNLTHTLLAVAALLLAPATAFADGRGDAGPDAAAPPIQAAPLPQSTAAPQGQTGQVALSEINLNVPRGYAFYGPQEALAYLQRNSAPAPQGEVYGLIARADADIRQPGTWATVVSFDAIGYVQAETAAGLTDANFETSVRSARQQQQRAFEGFATEPAFDASGLKLTWAERAAAPGSQGPDLRFEQKSLGRYGVACLTSIGSADQMTEIAAAADDLAAMLSFPAGRQHADFQANADRISSYYVPGLVTGVPQPEGPQAVAEPVGGAGSGQTSFGGMSSWFPWIAFGVIAAAIAGYLLMRKRRTDEAEA